MHLGKSKEDRIKFLTNFLDNVSQKSDDVLIESFEEHPHIPSCTTPSHEWMLSVCDMLCAILGIEVTVKIQCVVPKRFTEYLPSAGIPYVGMVIACLEPLVNL